jgi:hypothetical protein
VEGKDSCQFFSRKKMTQHLSAEEIAEFREIFNLVDRVRVRTMIVSYPSFRMAEEQSQKKN